MVDLADRMRRADDDLFARVRLSQLLENLHVEVKELVNSYPRCHHPSSTVIQTCLDTTAQGVDRGVELGMRDRKFVRDSIK